MYKFSEGARVVFYGDSITQNGRWLRRVYDYYLRTAKIKCEMYNFGVSGNSAKRAYARIDGIYRFNPTDVVIMFGMNDVAYTSYNNGALTEEKLKEIRAYRDDNFSYYEKICEELSSKGIRLVFCTPTIYDEISDIDEPIHLGALGAAREYADRVLNLAKKYGNNVVELNLFFFEKQKQAYKKGFSFIGADRVHPTNVGHELMARYFLFSQGFDVKYDLSFEEFEKASEEPFSAWEDKRFELEKIAKRCDYTRYDYFWNVKGTEEIIKRAQNAIDTHEAASWAKGETLDYVEGCFRDFILYHDDAEKALEEYIAFTKTVKV